MTVARYIALSLISRYLSMDPTNRDISGLHCTQEWSLNQCVNVTFGMSATSPISFQDGETMSILKESSVLKTKMKKSFAKRKEDWLTSTKTCDKENISDLVHDCCKFILNALELLQSCSKENISGLVQDCNNSIASALELLQFCTKLSIYHPLWPPG